MGEYTESHSVSKLIGAPPGYIGHDDGGLLISEMTKNPNRVILFDEIEKAHPDVLKILLNLLDDGVLRDTRGRSVSFKNSIVILTTTSGFESEKSATGFIKTENVEEKSFRFLGNELLGRIDEVLFFSRADEETAKKMIKDLFDKMINTLKGEKINLLVDERVSDYLLEKSNISKLGYRNLKKIFHKEIENKVFSFIDERGEDKPEIFLLINDENKIEIKETFRKLNLENVELSMYNKQKYVD